MDDKNNKMFQNINKTDCEKRLLKIKIDNEYIPTVKIVHNFFKIETF